MNEQIPVAPQYIKDFEQENDILSVNFTGFLYGISYCVRVAEVKFK